MYINETTFVAFQQVVNMLKDKKSLKNKKIKFGMKDVNKHLSPIAINVLLQIDKETIGKAKIIDNPRLGQKLRKERDNGTSN